MTRRTAEFRINLRRMARLCTFRRVSQGGIPVRTPYLVLVLGLCLALTAGFSFLMAGPEPYFSEWGVVTFIANWAVFALVVALLTARSRAIPLSRAIADNAGIIIAGLLIALAMVFWWLNFAEGLSKRNLPVHYIWYGMFFTVSVWSVAAMWHAGSRLWQKPVRFAGLRLVLAAIVPVLLVPRSSMFNGPNTDWTRVDLWYFAREALNRAEDEKVATSQPPRIDYETTLYRQPEMVAKAISRLDLPHGDAPRFYFLGIAPSSAQTVFKSEVLGAQSAFDQRLGAKGRSFVMVNSLETLAEYPLASVTNLDTAVAAMAKVMRPEKDVLALFITSHGSAGTISVSLPGFPLNQIEPDMLASTLRNSGIKNRVIIISACYSGSFIQALANPDTLIMTAASADKTSFGCSNERDWTYFGDAFFNHALKKTTSLPKAFETARDLIRSWEAEQELTPSDPQVSLGKNIEKILQTVNLDTVSETSLSLH